MQQIQQKRMMELLFEVEPQKEVISYDDFIKMDLRTGTILEAEKVPKSNKLLKFLVDTGVDKRTF